MRKENITIFVQSRQMETSITQREKMYIYRMDYIKKIVLNPFFIDWYNFPSARVCRHTQKYQAT